MATGSPTELSTWKRLLAATSITTPLATDSTSPVGAENKAAGSRFSSVKRTAATIFILFSLGLILNGVNLANPGYYSTDDVRFGGYSRNPQWFHGDPSFSFFYFDHFHYRPATWRATMLIANRTFDVPQVYHLVIVGMAIINAMLVVCIGRLLMCSKQFCFAMYLAFLLYPAVANNAGHVSAIGDHLCLFFTLLVGVLLAFDYRRTATGRATRATSILLHVAAAACLVAGMTTKESMILVPPMLVIVGLCCVRWRGLFVAIGWSGALSLLYVVLRWDGMNSMKQGDYYHFSFARLAERLLCYFTYPFMRENHLVNDIYFAYPGINVGVAAAMHTAIIVLLALKSWRAALGYVALWLVSLLPVIPLGVANPNYLYACGIPMAFAMAILLCSEWKFQRGFAVCCLAVFAMHSFNVQKQFYETGAVQQRFFNSLHCVLLSPPAVKEALTVAQEINRGPVVVVNTSDYKSFFRINGMTHGIKDFDNLAVKGIEVTLNEPLDPKTAANGKVYLQLLEGGCVALREPTPPTAIAAIAKTENSDAVEVAAKPSPNSAK